MAIVFPPNPTVGQEHFDEPSKSHWTFDGTGWVGFPMRFHSLNSTGQGVLNTQHGGFTGITHSGVGIYNYVMDTQERLDPDDYLKTIAFSLSSNGADSWSHPVGWVAAGNRNRISGSAGAQNAAHCFKEYVINNRAV